MAIITAPSFSLSPGGSQVLTLNKTELAALLLDTHWSASANWKSVQAIYTSAYGRKVVNFDLVANTGDLELSASIPLGTLILNKIVITNFEGSKVSLTFGKIPGASGFSVIVASAEVTFSLTIKDADVVLSNGNKDASIAAGTPAFYATFLDYSFDAYTEVKNVYAEFKVLSAEAELAFGATYLPDGVTPYLNNGVLGPFIISDSLTQFGVWGAYSYGGNFTNQRFLNANLYANNCPSFSQDDRVGIQVNAISPTDVRVNIFVQGVSIFSDTPWAASGVPVGDYVGGGATGGILHRNVYIGAYLQRVSAQSIQKQTPAQVAFLPVGATAI